MSRGIAGLDVELLQEAIRAEYAQVASDPGRGFHFHSFRAWKPLRDDEWREALAALTCATG